MEGTIIKNGRTIPLYFQDVCNRDAVPVMYHYKGKNESTHGNVYEYHCENCKEIKRLGSSHLEAILTFMKKEQDYE